jgi:signal transduction histidine kinase
MTTIQPRSEAGARGTWAVAAVSLSIVVGFIAFAVWTSSRVSEQRRAVEQRVGWLRALSAEGSAMGSCGPEREAAAERLRTLASEVRAEAITSEARRSLSLSEAACSSESIAEDRDAVAQLERALRAETGRLSATLGDDVDRLFWVAIAACVVALGLGVALLDGLRMRLRLAAQGRRLREQALEMADRERALRQSAAVIAHEINNPLLFLRMSAQLAKEGDPIDERSHAELLEAAIEAGDRIGAVTEELRELGRQSVSALEPIDVPAVAARAGRLFAAGSRRRLTSTFEPVPPVQANAARLGQVVLNLLRNADDASAGSSPIVLEVAARDGAVEIAVRDHGTGIAPEVRAALFTPFVTTKGASGTGLGLHVSRNIVESFGGSITLDDADGGGAVARIRLPPAP